MIIERDADRRRMEYMGQRMEMAAYFGGIVECRAGINESPLQKSGTSLEVNQNDLIEKRKIAQSSTDYEEKIPDSE